MVLYPEGQGVLETQVQEAVMKPEAKIEKKVAELKGRRGKPMSFEEFNKLETQIDTLQWVLVEGFTIWLD